MDHLHDIQVMVQLPSSLIEDLHVVCSSQESSRSLLGLIGATESADDVTEIVLKRVLNSLSIDN